MRFAESNSDIALGWIAARCVGGGGRGAKSLLRSPCWPQSFLKNPKCFKMRVLPVEVLHHQYLAPNCSQLGVSISTSRKPRAVRAHSACAMGMHGLGRRAVGSTLFCPLFSQNLHQLFRRGTRTLTFVAIAYVRASLQGFPADLDRRCMSRTPFTAWPHTALHTALRVPAYPREFGRRDEAPRIVPP